MNRLFAILLAVTLLGLSASLGFAAAEKAITMGDLAGEYFFGDGTGINCTLKLQAEGTFSFRWEGCFGTYGQNDGAASVKDDVLEITPSKPNARGDLGGTPTRFFAVCWDARTYLIPPEDMIGFCNAVNNELEPRKESHGQFYLRREQWTKRPLGKPAVPAEYQKYLLPKPVHGKITQVTEAGEIWINLGSDVGICQGMTLIARGEKRGFYPLSVESVEKDRCRAKSKFADETTELLAGQTVSSRFKY